MWNEREKTGTISVSNNEDNKKMKFHSSIVFPFGSFFSKIDENTLKTKLKPKTLESLCGYLYHVNNEIKLMSCIDLVENYKPNDDEKELKPMNLILNNLMKEAKIKVDKFKKNCFDIILDDKIEKEIKNEAIQFIKKNPNLLDTLDEKYNLKQQNY